MKGMEWLKKKSFWFQTQAPDKTSAGYYWQYDKQSRGWTSMLESCHGYEARKKERKALHTLSGNVLDDAVVTLATPLILITLIGCLGDRHSVT